MSTVIRTDLSHIIDHFAFTVNNDPEAFIRERNAINNYLSHISIAWHKKICYNLSQFFKAFFGKSDYQVTTKTLQYWVFARIDNREKSVSIAKQICKIFEAAALDNSLIKNLAVLNKILPSIQNLEQLIPIPFPEKAINFTQSEIEVLQKIYRRERDISFNGQLVELTTLSRNHDVIEINLFPGLIFKYDKRNPLSIPARYTTMLEARQVIIKEQLSSLSIPGNILLSFGSDHILVERKYQYKRGQEMSLYEEQDNLEKAIKELTILICKTNFSDVKWNNLPLIAIENQMKIGLIDLEKHESHTAIDGLVGWGDPGMGEKTMGLIAMFPQYIDLIIDTAKGCGIDTSDERITSLVPKAYKINARHQEIVRFHVNRNITVDTPALNIKDVENLAEDVCKLVTDEKRVPLETLLEIVQDINCVIHQQSQLHKNLIDAREWRLTLDQRTADSNFNQNIRKNFDFILEIMVPSLIKKGIIHSVLEGTEAINVGIDVKRHFSTYDYIIQF